MSPKSQLWQAITVPLCDELTFFDWHAAQSSLLMACCQEIFANDLVVLYWPQRPYRPGALLSHSQEYTYRRYGGGDLFARMTLTTAPANTDTFQVALQMPGTRIGQPTSPLIQYEEWSSLFPCLLKGLWDGLQKHPLPAGQWVLNQVAIHPIDSRPIAFYLCGRTAIQELSEKFDSVY